MIITTTTCSILESQLTYYCDEIDTSASKSTRFEPTIKHLIK